MTTNSRYTIQLTTVLLLSVLAPSVFGGCSSSSSTGPNGEKEENVKRIVEAPSRPELELLEDAKQSYDKGMFKIAAESWIALRDGYPTSYYAILAELKTADSYYYSHQYPEAIAAYQEFIRGHSGHEAVPYAKYQIAVANLMQYQGNGHDQTPLTGAITKFEELITDAPRSEYATAARARIKDCRELLAENEALIAEFYLRQGKVESSTNRYEGILANYADTETGREKATDLRTKIVSTGQVDERSIPQVATPATFEGDPLPPMILSATADDNRTDKRSAASAPVNTAEAASTKSSNSRSKFVENNLLDENTNKDGDSAPESFVSSINCVEQADGARLITVTLNEEPEVTAEKKESSNLVLKFRPRGNSSTTLADNKNGDSTKIQSCRAGDLSAEVSRDENEMTLRTSGKEITDYTQLVLDRPFRLAVIVR